MVHGLRPTGKPTTQKKNYEFWTEPRPFHGPWTQAYGETNYSKEKLRGLDRTKAMDGRRTQAKGETNYSKEKLRVLDRTKALHGPRTQADGENNY